jgi:phosphoserine phosphatase
LTRPVLALIKEVLARKVDLDIAALPYDETVLGLIEEARAAGRRVYLASASNAKFVSAVAEHVGLFSGWFASDASTNMSGHKKADLLVQTFGERGFDYIGNDAADLPVWAVASKRNRHKNLAAPERQARARRRRDR